MLGYLYHDLEGIQSAFSRQRIGLLFSAVVLSLLAAPEMIGVTALFCSARTLGDAILRAHDAARRLRDAGITVISGFHSPIEQECLRILLRGAQPIIICPARALDAMRIPTECRAAFAAGRVLFLSPFSQKPKRITQDSALRRNEVVAALADEAYLAHIASGGKTDQILKQLREWQVPIL